MSAMRTTIRTRTVAGGRIRTEGLTFTAAATAWSLGAASTLSLMHIGDELWSRWDIGESMVTSGAFAGLVLAIPAVATFFALAGILMSRGWGYWIAAVLGVWSLWPPLSHVIDTHDMTGYRWTVEILAAAAALAVIAFSIKHLTGRGRWKA